MHSNWVTQVIKAAHPCNSFPNATIWCCSRLGVCPSLGLGQLPQAWAAASSWRGAHVSSSAADSLKPAFCCRGCTAFENWGFSSIKNISASSASLLSYAFPSCSVKIPPFAYLQCRWRPDAGTLPISTTSPSCQAAGAHSSWF